MMGNEFLTNSLRPSDADESGCVGFTLGTGIPRLPQISGINFTASELFCRSVQFSSVRWLARSFVRSLARFSIGHRPALREGKTLAWNHNRSSEKRRFAQTYSVLLAIRTSVGAGEISQSRRRERNETMRANSLASGQIGWRGSRMAALTE